TFSVTAYLHHLRAAIERGVRLLRMGRATYDSADLKHRCKLRTIRDRDVVTAQFPSSPAGYIKPLSSSDRLRAVTNGGTALKPFNSGGKRSGSAGSAGISITFVAPQCPLSRFHNQTDAERSLSETTTPAKPNVRVGS